MQAYDKMTLPALNPEEIDAYLLSAKGSPRRRALKILHSPGFAFNQVVNFVLTDSYMQPHRHPDPKREEEIWLMEGKLAILFFDDQGEITKSIILGKGRDNYIKIPPLAWHTYVALSEHTISYETMTGVYDPATWKESAKWAPAEGGPEVPPYLDWLKKEAMKRGASN